MQGRFWRGAAVVVILLALVLVFFALLWQGPWLLDRTRLHSVTLAQASVVTGFRTALVALGAGMVAVAGLVYTARTHWLAREGQVTDRYASATKQLASAQLTERLGGIYALERIMRDSAKDHATVVAVLAAYVREHAPRNRDTALRDGASARQPTQDVEAVMIVLARRPNRKEPVRLDLRGVGLAGLEIPWKARLAEADFTDADLSSTRLFKADLRGTDMHGVNLTAARLVNADLSAAEGLEARQLAGAWFDHTTKLPGELASHPWVRVRIEACLQADKEWRSLPPEERVSRVTPVPPPTPQPPPKPGPWPA
jgi:hypothetical protein